MSPPLVVAYAIAGRIDVDFEREPLDHDPSGRPVFLRDVRPHPAEIQEALRVVRPEMFARSYAGLFGGQEAWRTLAVARGQLFNWDPESTYIRRPPYFEDLPRRPESRPPDVAGARVLAHLGDGVTTDHISPAGSIPRDSPAGRYLQEHGVAPSDFNSYGARRGNHEVMVRGTFASPRLRNHLAGGREGGYTTFVPTGDVVTVYEAAMRYAGLHTPLVVLAGREYGSGSSRDWAAKGPKLLGVRAVLAESYERIHRSNLVGMGVLPLQFRPGESARSLGLSGHESYDIEGIDAALDDAFVRREVRVRVRSDDGRERAFDAVVRIDTPVEAHYYRHGGILPFVLRALLEDEPQRPAEIAARTSVPTLETVRAGVSVVDEGSIESFPASDPPSYQG